MKTENERNRIIGRIDEWQKANRNQRMALVLLCEGDVLSAGLQTCSKYRLIGALTALMAYNGNLAGIILKAAENFSRDNAMKPDGPCPLTPTDKNLQS